MDLTTLPWEYIAGVIVLFAGGTLSYSLFLFSAPVRTVRDRLHELTTMPGQDLETLISQEKLNPISEALAKVATPAEEEDLSALKKRLYQAGYRSRNIVELYSVTRVALTIVLPMMYAVIPSQSSLSVTMFVVLLIATVGYYLPSFWVKNKLQHRQETILRSFPDALDLMVSSVEAGLGVDAAFRRVAEELTNAAPVLSAELMLFNHEVSTGITRVDALKRLYERTGVEPVRSLVNVLAQAEKFGTPVAKALRIHSKLVRTKRMQTAEEKAAQISPYMTLAMIVFILPCLIIILVGPAVINVKNQLLPVLGAVQ